MSRNSGHYQDSAQSGSRLRGFGRCARGNRPRVFGTPTRLLNACPPVFWELVTGVLLTGCRYGEWAAMKAGDFDPQAGTVTVGRSKSGRTRHVVLTDEVRAFFARQTAGKTGSAAIFDRDIQIRQATRDQGPGPGDRAQGMEQGAPVPPIEGSLRRRPDRAGHQFPCPAPHLRQPARHARGAHAGDRGAARARRYPDDGAALRPPWTLPCGGYRAGHVWKSGNFCGRGGGVFAARLILN